MTAPALKIVGDLYAGQRPLIESLDLTLPAGQWSVLLGHSGLGKTSLLRCIAGLPGAARLNGRLAADDAAPLPPRVAMMGQDSALLPWASALDNITIGVRLRGERADMARARALLADVGLADRAAHKPATLSAGQRQRIALARTLFENRDIVLLDEPFSALDALTRFDMQDLAARLLKGRTTILITHDPAEAMRLADHAWLLHPSGARTVSLPPGPTPRAPGDGTTLAAAATLIATLRAAA